MCVRERERARGRERGVVEGLSLTKAKRRRGQSWVRNGGGGYKRKEA